MKKAMLLFALIAASCSSWGDETVYIYSDIYSRDWYFTASDIRVDSWGAHPGKMTVVGIQRGVGGKLTIPSKWDDNCPVVSIGDYAFDGSFILANTSVIIPSCVTNIGAYAFRNCTGLVSVTIPVGVTYMSGSQFNGCSNLTNIVFAGNAPVINAHPDNFRDVPTNCTVSVHLGTMGWDDAGQGTWQGFSLRCIELGDSETRSWVHDYLAERYKKDSETVEDYYKRFEEKFGTNYSAVAFMKTGKVGPDDSKLSVWQDYVAGTDPTNTNNMFKATITMIEGNPQVQWSPELVEKEAAKRVYTKYGKVQLQDEEWVKIPEGDESKYNFYRVTVRMK